MRGETITNKYILTVTLNPAVDTMLVYNKINNISRIKKEIRSAGGKGINVSRALNNFGWPNLSTGIVGGENGREICRKAVQEKIWNRFHSAVCESRNNIILLVPAFLDRKRIFLKTPTVSRTEYERFKDLYKKLIHRADLVVLSGSVPGGISAEAYAELTRIAHQLKIPVFLDASHAALRAGLKATPEFIKPNRQEIAQLLGVKVSTFNEARNAVLRLRKLKVENIYISLGSQGAIGCNNNDLWYAKAPQIKALNSVGCGDAFVGAVCVGYLQKLSFQECLRLAVAAGTVNAMSLTPGQIDIAQVNKMKVRIKLNHWCI